MGTLDAGFVSAVVVPLGDALGFDEAGTPEDLEVSGCRGLGDPDLVCDQGDTDPGVAEVTFPL
jgi:hypothetical protein